LPRLTKEFLPMSRPLAALVLSVFTVLGGVVLYPPECAHACSCAMPPGSQKERAERALSDSEAVFSGEVVRIDRPSGPMQSSGDPETDTFRVLKSWKGPKSGTFEVKTPVSDISCGYPFEKGREYLVYASEKRQGLEVYLCGETKPLPKAKEDLAALGEGENLGKDEALTDTSGVVPAHTVIGMAALALTVSLLVMARLVRSGYNARHKG
jgi:hypothetical protein